MAGYDKKEIRNIAFTYVGTVIGAGFATGKEIVEFFSINGGFGTFGIIVSTFLFSLLGTKIMLIANENKLQSAQAFNVMLFGNIGGNIINGLLFFVLLGVTSVMLSGAGAIFHDHLKFNPILGSIIFIILTFIILLKGTVGLFSLNNTVVPIMCLYVVTIFINANIDKIFSPNIDLGSIIPTTYHLNSNVLTNPITYVCLNMALAQAVLVPIGAECTNKSSLKIGGILGGVILGMILLISHFSISTINHFKDFEIPMAEVIKQIHPFFYFLFLFVILAEIFTTLVGNIYGMTKQLTGTYKINQPIIVLTILIVCFFISIIGYGPLLTFLYPLIGWITFIVMITLLRPSRKN
jgi:uncharacterized membrane protein YkvI